MPRYTLPTLAKLNYLQNVITQHPDYGSSKLQNAIKEKFGSQLKKQYLLTEADAIRRQLKIESPRVAQGDYAKLNRIMRQGGYSDFEKEHFIKQIARYTPEGRKNFVNSEVLKKASEQHAEWFKSLLDDARKIAPNLTAAKAMVYDRLQNLIKLGQYDPFVLLQEQEKPETVLSGIVKIRPLKRDYTEARRRKAERKRNLVAQKVMRR